MSAGPDAPARVLSVPSSTSSLIIATIARQVRVQREASLEIGRDGERQHW